MGVVYAHLGPNGFAQVNEGGVVEPGLHVRGVVDGFLRFEFKQIAHGMFESLVEINEKARCRLFVERPEVVGIVVEKGAVFVGAHNGVPVEAAPSAVVADSNIAGAWFQAVAMHNGYAQSQRPALGSNQAAVAIGLFHKVVAPFLHYVVAAKEFGVALHRSQIGRREQDHRQGGCEVRVS